MCVCVPFPRENTATNRQRAEERMLEEHHLFKSDPQSDAGGMQVACHKKALRCQAQLSAEVLLLEQ